MPNSIFGLPGSGNPDTIPKSSDWQCSNYRDVWIYNKPGTYYWTKPDGVKYIMFTYFGGGGGGGSGRKGAVGSARGAGGPGGGGGPGFFSIEASAIPSTMVFVVGAGGSGGAARTTNNQDGANGSNGTATQIIMSGTTIFSGGGGAGGTGGTTTTVTNAAPVNAHFVAGWTTFDVNSNAMGGFGESLNSSNVITARRAGVCNQLSLPFVWALWPVSMYGGAGGIIGGAGLNGSNSCGGGGGGAGTNNVVDSGAGGNGGDGMVIVQAFGRNPDCDLKVFNNNGLWEKPSNTSFSMAYIICFGAGGGGGSGRLGATSTYRGGGAGGGPGGFHTMLVPLSQLPNRIDVTIGKGGAGGLGVSTSDTNGNPGSDGEFTSFGNICYAHQGLGGVGGSNAQTVAPVAPVCPTEIFDSSLTNHSSRLLQGRGGVSESLGFNGDHKGIPCVGWGGSGISAANANGTLSGGIRQYQWFGSSFVEPNYSSTDIPNPFNSDIFGGYYTSGPSRGGVQPTNINGMNGTRGNGGGGGAGGTNGSTSGAGGNGSNGQITVLCF